ncbi:MAG: hypothetical protein F6K39_47700, partial [Okeania sp. SIO3B3]|nr:hypothetical protein [Okeania sp. SIO3B3]
MHKFIAYWLLLYLLTACSTDAIAAPEPDLGFHLGRGDSAHMEAAHAAGADFVVVVFSWANIEPAPNYLYWEVPDAAIRAAEFHGIKVVARLDRPPNWAMSDDDPSRWRLDAYANFVRRVVERYGDRLAGVIIWNEPNLRLEWQNHPPDPRTYVLLLQHGYEAAKSVKPDLPVLMAGLAFTDDDTNNMNDLDYLRQVYRYGGGAYFDIMAAHPYGFGQAPTAEPSVDALNFRRMELHREIMIENGDADKPIWITEMGWRIAAPNPADAWQVVSAEQKADYRLEGIR